MSRLHIALAAALVVAAPGASAFAQKIDGKQSVICAFMDSRECPADGVCEGGDADDLRLPDFIRIDFKKKRMSALDGERRGETTDYTRLERSGGFLVLQGIEGSRGWTLLIAEDGGDVVLTVSDSGTGFVVFGECTLP